MDGAFSGDYIDFRASYAPQRNYDYAGK